MTARIMYVVKNLRVASRASSALDNDRFGEMDAKAIIFAANQVLIHPITA